MVNLMRDNMQQPYDERRDYNRMNASCEVVYRLADAETVYQGRCTSISGAGMTFVTDQTIVIGKALEVKISSGSKSSTPSLIAYIEPIRCTSGAESKFEIAAVIKGIKAD